jgi:hypothetical protein
MAPRGDYGGPVVDLCGATNSDLNRVICRMKTKVERID